MPMTNPHPPYDAQETVATLAVARACILDAEQAHRHSPLTVRAAREAMHQLDQLALMLTGDEWALKA